MTAKTPTADDPFAPPARLPRLGALWRTRRHAPWPLRYGLALPLALGLMHLVGLREWVGVVSGTPVPGVPFAVAAPVGFVYVLTWLATLALAPPMLLNHGLHSSLLGAVPDRVLLSRLLLVHQL